MACDLSLAYVIYLDTSGIYDHMQGFALGTPP
jgi:hypothetical protein